MKTRLLILMTGLFLSSGSFSQPIVTFHGLAGANHIFSSTTETRIGASAKVGCGLILGDEKHIQFKPRVYVFLDRYRARYEPGRAHLNDQAGLGLDLMAGLPLGKKFSLSAGIFVSYTVLQYNAISQQLGNGVFIEQTIDSDPQAQRWQGGGVLALSYWLGKKKRWSLDLQFRQHASSVFKTGLSGFDIWGNPIDLYPQNSKPTFLMVGATYCLGR